MTSSRLATCPPNATRMLNDHSNARHHCVRQPTIVHGYKDFALLAVARRRNDRAYLQQIEVGLMLDIQLVESLSFKETHIVVPPAAMSGIGEMRLVLRGAARCQRRTMTFLGPRANSALPRVLSTAA